MHGESTLHKDKHDTLSLLMVEKGYNNLSWWEGLIVKKSIDNTFSSLFYYKSLFLSFPLSSLSSSSGSLCMFMIIKYHTSEDYKVYIIKS